METTEREGFFLDPREPEKLAEWTEEKSKYCEKFWSVELDRYLIVSIEQHGVFWPKPFWKTTKGIVQDAVRSHPLGVDALDPDNRWLGSEWEGERRRLAQSTVWTEIGWAFQRYACRRASQIPAAINAYARRLAEQSEYQRCLLCTWQFRPCDLPDYLYVEGEGEGDFCHTCLMTMITHDPRGHDVSRIPLRKQDMTAALARLVELMGFVPPQNFNSIETLLRVERRRRPNVVAYIWTMRNPNEYKRKFGSWLKALIAAEVLDDDCYPTGIGTKCIARDGHECRSLEEKQIDDWFFEAGIIHRTEPFYPYHPELNPSKRSRADWEVDEVFVEYWGLIGDRQYDRRIKNKRKLAQESGIVLIELYPSDLQNLSLKLGQLRKVD